MADRFSWGQALPTLLPDTWRSFLGDDLDSLLRAIGDELDDRARHENILPAPHRVFRALTTPPTRVDVLIVGQDPYPTPEHATGLAFSVPHSVWPLPPTLRNILRELSDDTGVSLPRHGNLRSWQDQGVLLLNRHLTTGAHLPAAHQHIGWARVTDRIVERLSAARPHLVSVLWGQHAQELQPLLRDTHVLSSPHPSPLSARRGFFGSRPFTAVNKYREAMGLDPIDWSLDETPGCQKP